jgi:nucleoside-diphosphate kinase
MIERTLVLFKADAVQRGVVGEILSRFEKVGLKLIGMKMVWVDKNFAAKHYFDVKERYGERIFLNLADYLTEGPVVAIALEGVQAVSQVRKMAGSTYPNEALPGTIRGDYSHISKAHANKNEVKVGNLVHSSANPEEALQELKLWFSIEELHEYKVSHEQHIR